MGRYELKDACLSCKTWSFMMQKAAFGIVKDLFAAGVKARLRGIAVVNGGHFIAINGSGSVVFGFERVNGVEKTIGGNL